MGGGATIKTVIFENYSGSVVILSQVINTDGKYVLSENPEDGVVIPDGETYTAKYVEPITGGKWSVPYKGDTTATCPTGISNSGFDFGISPEAEDGAVVVVGIKITPPLG